MIWIICQLIADSATIIGLDPNPWDSSPLSHNNGCALANAVLKAHIVANTHVTISALYLLWHTQWLLLTDNFCWHLDIFPTLTSVLYLYAHMINHCGAWIIQYNYTIQPQRSVIYQTLIIQFLQGQYHDCLWPGDKRSDGNISQGIDTVTRIHFEFKQHKVNIMTHMPIWFALCPLTKICVKYSEGGLCYLIYFVNFAFCAIHLNMHVMDRLIEPNLGSETRASQNVWYTWVTPSQNLELSWANESQYIKIHNLCKILWVAEG